MVAAAAILLLALPLPGPRCPANQPHRRWIFIIEGILTCVVGILGFCFLQEFPDRSTFLTEDEKYIVKTRIQRDRGDATPDPLTLAKCGQYALDLKTWVFGIMFFGATLASYALSYFLPTILQSMGFNNMESQLLFAPPKVWGIIPGIIVAWLCDRYKQRAYGVIFNGLLLVLGMMMFYKLSNKGARYTGVFLAFGGATANVPLLMAWAQVNIRSQSNRAFTSAIIIAWGGIGGICSGLLFMEKEGECESPPHVYGQLTRGSQDRLPHWYLVDCRYQRRVHCARLGPQVLVHVSEQTRRPWRGRARGPLGLPLPGLNCRSSKRGEVSRK